MHFLNPSIQRGLSAHLQADSTIVETFNLLRTFSCFIATRVYPLWAEVFRLSS